MNTISQRAQSELLRSQSEAAKAIRVAFVAPSLHYVGGSHSRFSHLQTSDRRPG
jgi:hypothetical protein